MSLGYLRRLVTNSRHAACCKKVSRQSGFPLQASCIACGLLKRKITPLSPAPATPLIQQHLKLSRISTIIECTPSFLPGPHPLQLMQDVTASEDAKMGEVPEAAEAVGEAAADATGDDEVADLIPAQVLGPQEVEMHLHVKDAGMMLVSTVAPDIAWQSGSADISFRCTLALHIAFTPAQKLSIL